MKKYIFTESQIKKIISEEINEQVPTMGKCVNGLLKNAIVEDKNPNILQKIKNGKFKVKHISNQVKLNGKYYDNSSIDKGIIITPDTTIEICVGSFMSMSGMGLSECGVFFDPDGIKFTAQMS